MRTLVGREASDRPAASSSQMGPLETEWLATDGNLDAPSNLSGAWIDRVHRRRAPDGIMLDQDSSESPSCGQQEGAAHNGHFCRTCYRPLCRFNPFGDLERCLLRPGNVHSAEVRAIYRKLTSSTERGPTTATASGPMVVSAQTRPAAAPTTLWGLHAAADGRKLDHGHAASGGWR